MSSVRWSQYNDDSSSVSSASSGLEEVIGISSPSKIKSMEPATMKKIQSSPPSYQTVNKYESKIIENLDKLANHKEDTVWLYLGQYYQSEENTVVEILNNHDSFDKVLPMKRGWNLLIKTEKAKEYLQKGLTQRGLQLRFIYSNKNQKDSERTQKNDRYDKEENNRKYRADKNQNRDYKSPNSRFQDAKSPKLKGRKTYAEKNGDNKDDQKQQKYKNDYKKQIREEVPKKKVKYVAKDSNRQQTTDKNNNKKQNPQNNLNHPEIKEQPSQESISSPDLEEKRSNGVAHKNNGHAKIEEESNDLKKFKEPETKFSLKKSNGSQQQTKEQANESKKQKKYIQSNIKKQVEKEQEQIDSDSSEEIKKKKKQLEKKKAKRKKNGNKNPSVFQDPSNPFSSLAAE